MTKDEIEYKAYLFFREKGLEYVDNIDELIEYCRDFAFPFVSYFEEKIADLKANFDYILEGKDLEIKTLGERCNQLLKDKGDLTDELSKLKETLAQTIENDEVNYETLKLHDQEEIGMLNSKIAELEQQIEKMKRHCNCKHRDSEGYCEVKRTYLMDLSYDGCDKWELEND